MTSWQTKKLGEIVTKVTKGTTPTTVGFSYQNNGINFIKIESVDNSGNFDCSKFAHIGINAHNALERSQLSEGDILFSIAGAIGRVAIVTKDILPANTNQALAIIKGINSNIINKHFLMFVLASFSLSNSIDSLTAGVAQLNLSLAQVANFDIPIPLINEQRIIVKVLSTCDSYEKKLVDRITHITNLKKGLMQQIFSGKLRFKDSDGKDFPEWRKEKLGRVVKNIKPPQKLQTSQYLEVGQFPIVDQSAKKIIGYTNDQSTTLPIDSYIIFGDHSEEVKFVDFSFAQGADGIKILQSECKDILTHYLFYIFSHNYIKQGNYRRHWNIAKEILICIPSIEEQQKIATFLSTLDDLINTLKSLHHETIQQKKWLLNNLVTGKIRLPQFREKGGGNE